jgi:BirA family biotin operon repressor/biotin-[acetyl-CoA-carboxylase] ligase
MEKESKRYNLLVHTDYQLKGRGQEHSVWESERGKNLLCSFNLFDIGLQADKQFFISAVVALSLVDLLKKHDICSNVHIKWPNDIYVEGNKIAGVLIEHSLRGIEIERTIIGLGFNVNQIHFSDQLVNPISLQLLDGKKRSIEDFMMDFITCFGVWYEVLLEKEFSKIRDSYLKLLYRKDEFSLYLINGEEIKATIRGVDDIGFLQLEVNNELQSFDVKQLEYL